jgi:hypothetical protein
MLRRGSATHLPRFRMVFAVKFCNAFAMGSQYSHQVFTRHLPLDTSLMVHLLVRGACSDPSWVKLQLPNGAANIGFRYCMVSTGICGGKSAALSSMHVSLGGRSCCANRFDCNNYPTWCPASSPCHSTPYICKENVPPWHIQIRRSKIFLHLSGQAYKKLKSKKNAQVTL